MLQSSAPMQMAVMAGGCENAIVSKGALLRKAAERTVPTLHRRLGKLLASFTAADCANFFLHSGCGPI
jgi:hypothetical protein